MAAGVEQEMAAAAALGACYGAELELTCELAQKDKEVEAEFKAKEGEAWLTGSDESTMAGGGEEMGSRVWSGSVRERW